MKIVLIEGSPRRGGNTAQLAGLLAEHLQESGADVARISVAERYFEPCNGCNACLKTGECVIDDERDAMPAIYQELENCDGLLWMTPLYFAGVPAQLKALIDRLQVYYGRRLLRGKPTTPRRPAAAVILGAGGDPFGAQAAILTLRSASQMAEFTLADPLVITGTEEPGDISAERFASERAAALALADALRERVQTQTQVSGDA